MNKTDHELARKWMAASLVERIDGDQQSWLDQHLASCGECCIEADTLKGVMQSLHAFHATAGTDLVRRTQSAVHSRARQLRAERVGAIPLWIAVAMSGISTILTAAVAWEASAWLGQVTYIPNVVWPVAFMILWFLPASIVAAAVAWRHASAAEFSNWGQR
jgi:hypothetical protein